jgi:hypothetical protein
MNFKSKTAFLALLVGAGISSAFADDITIDPVPFVSTKTRAEVVAELHAYKKAGINPWSRSYDPLKYFKSTKSRAEVTAEYLREREAVAALNGEDSGSAYLAAERAHSQRNTRMAGNPEAAK